MDDYLDGSPLALWLLRESDWIFPNCHPYWAGYTDTLEAVGYVQSKYDQLCALTGKVVVIKETGWPSQGCGYCSVQMMCGFWRQMRLLPVQFCYFEAFDQYWKDWGAVEPYWGLNDRYRVNKCGRFFASVELEDHESWGRVKSLFR